MKNRTGTKGYMPPESLFHHQQQTSAVDVWASGVIFLSLLAGRHPVFSLNNSAKIKNFTIQNLIPLTCIFGAKAIKELGFKYGYGVLIPADFQQDPIALKTLVRWEDEQAVDLLE